MSKYVILAEMTCDLTAEIRDFIGMTDYVKGHVHFDDGKDMPAAMDWENVGREEFYKALSNKKSKISTSPANVAEYCEIFEKYAQEGYKILCMCLSSKISATLDFASQAAGQVKEKYPEAEIYCFDSFRMSGAFGLLVIYAHLLQKDGKSMEEVIAWLEENKHRVHQMGPIDDLIFIARRGRISMGKAIMGSFAGVKPMGDCNTEGYSTVITKTKGITKALDVTVQYVKETVKDSEDQYLLVAHSNRELYANTLKEKLEAAIPCKKVLLSEVFPGCGANIGPGMVGVYYLGEPVSEDLVKEKEAIARITGK